MLLLEKLASVIKSGIDGKKKGKNDNEKAFLSDINISGVSLANDWASDSCLPVI